MEKMETTVNFASQEVSATIDFQPSKIEAQIIPSVSGRSAYRIAVENGFIGTEVEWLVSLHGTNGTNGTDGTDGKNVEIRIDNGYIQWKYDVDNDWNNLIAIDSLKGIDGQEISLQISLTHIQWKLGDGEWKNLVALADLKGADGLSVNWKNDYSSEISYKINDAISYNGSSYISIKDGQANLPTNTEYWSLLAQKGTDGLGTGDMIATIYDPNNKQVDVYDYNNFINTPTIPTDINELADSASLLFSKSYNDLIDKPTLFSKSYTDLKDKPTIPTQTSELTNNSNFVSSTTTTTIWSGTQAEYDLLTPDLTTLYYIEET